MIDFTKLIVSNHAVDRAVERFSVKREEARKWIRTNLRSAEFVANVSDVDGKHGRMFAHRGIAYVLHAEADQVLTVFRNTREHVTLADRFKQMAASELRKWERKESALIRSVAVEKARLAVEVAMCHYRMTITPSKAVLSANERKLAEIEKEVAGLGERLAEVRRMKNAVAQGYTAYA